MLGFLIERYTTDTRWSEPWVVCDSDGVKQRLLPSALDHDDVVAMDGLDKARCDGPVDGGRGESKSGVLEGSNHAASHHPPQQPSSFRSCKHTCPVLSGKACAPLALSSEYSWATLLNG